MKTNRFKDIHKNKTVRFALVFVVGLLLGWLIFGGASGNKQAQDEEKHLHAEAEGQIWTCSMHPQIRQDGPGQCPLCGMDLIPLKSSTQSGGEAVDPNAIMMSQEAMALANVQTTVVSRQNPIKEIRLYGTIQADERLSQSQASHVSGRIEKLFVNFTGESVRKGQTIATIYSPDLLSAQQELLEAAKMEDISPGLLKAAKEKLRLWKVSDEQIAKIEKSQEISSTIDIQANTSGVVISKNVSQGDYVSQGNVLFDIANLSRVWALFDAYEVDLPFLKIGDKLTYTLQGVPGKTFTGKIAFINPILDPVTRTAKVRVETENTGMQLKPEMYANAIIEAPLNQYKDLIVIPKTAVLWTGKRSLVYIKQPDTETPAFKMTEVELGPSLGDAYVIMSGINDGDEIVTQGAFTVDASAQLEGKLSMMNQEGGPAMIGHNHGGMDIPAAGERSASSEGLTQNKELMVPVTADPAFKTQLTKVYNIYLDMKNAFVASDAKKVSAQAKSVGAALKSVNMDLLKGDAHMIWMEQLKTLNSRIDVIIKSDDIAKQRHEFVQFNLAFYKSVKMFGLVNKTAYYQYCPMANNDQGAYWFSETKEIRNPYFGEAMLACGETKETIK
ncbi:MAG: efflux RND transporter periplasmic adaptor subunit [Candidatus Saccharimonadaceae bacterium]